MGNDDIRDLVYARLDDARQAARQLQRRTDAETAAMLRAVADAIEADADTLLAANRSDMARMAPDDPRRDRLMLDSGRLRAIAADMRAVSSLPSPLGRELLHIERPNGLHISKRAVAFGVIGVIYEARPNVTFDVFSLCTKAGSACVLKGGRDAEATNEAAVAMIRRTLRSLGWNPDTAILLPSGHEATEVMLQAVGRIDLVIPRGSRRLIGAVRAEARVPVIETGAGVCHTYVHDSAPIDMARDIVANAKTRRVSVCNALDTLVVAASRLPDLPAICAPLADSHVEIHADSRSMAALAGRYPAELLKEAAPDDFGREWLDYKMSVATVDSLDQALEFIDAHTSRHSECIVAADTEAIARFQREVDAACVYANASTAFTDGGQFGFGAEIGISTQKLHARGPMALNEIVTYKYIVDGSGQTRNP